MKYLSKLFIITALMFNSLVAHSQKTRMVGLWEATQVTVGEKNMTPVAKWFRFNADGSTQGGNGRLQNIDGSWSYDLETNTFSAYDSLGIQDEYGAFDVSFSNEHMYWERIEDGMKVRITLRPIDQLPMSPADYLRGIWTLKEITKENESILEEFDPNNNHYLFFRWDRILVAHSENAGRHTAYWHIHGHRSEITILPHQKDAKPESWLIEVDENTLVMNGNSESNSTIEKRYKRTRIFPTQKGN